MQQKQRMVFFSCKEWHSYYLLPKSVKFLYLTNTGNAINVCQLIWIHESLIKRII